MRIAIATTGRFHVLDLAKELSALGHDVMFYSYVPRTMAVRYGLPAKCHRNFIPYVALLVAAQRCGPKKWRNWIDEKFLSTMDGLIARFLEPCDVFIGMSGLCIKCAETAKKKYGAKVFIERGSRHILSQKEILDAISMSVSGRAIVPDYYIKRELLSYETADTIVVPSAQALQSFLDLGVPGNKLFCNPYGVDLSMFMPTLCCPLDPPTILFVGGWSYRKGCDILTEAWRQLPGVLLMHVGAVADAPLPIENNFIHHDPVLQWRLSEIYAQAHVFVMASREEGLALVQAQALASGLPVVCTDRTGGADLAELAKLKEGVFVVPHDDVEALSAAISKALNWSRSHFSPGSVRDLLGPERERLSWREYGERYDKRFRNAIVGI